MMITFAVLFANSRQSRPRHDCAQCAILVESFIESTHRGDEPQASRQLHSHRNGRDIYDQLVSVDCCQCAQRFS